MLQRIDIVLVAIMRGPAEAAIYTAATRFLVAGQFGNTAIIMAAQPRFAELFAVGDRRGAGQVYQVTTAWLIVMTWPLYLLAVIYGPEVLSLFGHSYQAGHMVMIILGLTMLLSAACGQVDTVLITAGRSGWSLANGLMALIVNVGLDVLLIPRYGITGAAIGWSAAIVVSNLTPLAPAGIQISAASVRPRRPHCRGPGRAEFRRYTARRTRTVRARPGGLDRRGMRRMLCPGRGVVAVPRQPAACRHARPGSAPPEAYSAESVAS